MKKDFFLLRLSLISATVLIGIVVFFSIKIIDTHYRIKTVNLSIDLANQRNTDNQKKSLQTANTPVNNKTPYRVVYTDSENAAFIDYLINYFSLEIKKEQEYHKISGRLYEVVALMQYVYQIPKADRPNISFKAIKINQTVAELLLKF